MKILWILLWLYYVHVTVIKVLAQIFAQSLYIEKSNLKKFSVKISIYIKYNEVIFSVNIIERVKLSFKFKNLFIFWI